MAQDTEKAEIGRNGSPFYLVSSAEILLASLFLLSLRAERGNLRKSKTQKSKGKMTEQK